jgi:hypothetical protein
LMEFVGECDPRTILLGHGDLESRLWFEQQIKAQFPKIKVIQPSPALSVEV